MVRMKKSNKSLYWILYLCLLFFLPVASIQAEPKEEHELYDSLNNRIKNNWNEEIEKIEGMETVKQEGNLPERLLQNIVRIFYVNMKAIKGYSFLAGFLSFIMGALIAVMAKLNKGLRRFAIGGLMIGIPCILFLFVYGLALLIGLML